MYSEKVLGKTSTDDRRSWDTGSSVGDVQEEKGSPSGVGTLSCLVTVKDKAGTVDLGGSEERCQSTETRIFYMRL